MIGNSGNNVITGGAGADLMTGSGGADTFVISSGASTAIVGGAGDAGTVSGYDVIKDFNFDASADILTLPGTSLTAANAVVDGVNSTLTIGGQTIKSHAISNGVITFDDADAYSAALNLTSAANVAAAVQYLQQNDLGAAGTTVSFTAIIDGTGHSFVYEQVGDTPNSANDVLVDIVLPNVGDPNDFDSAVIGYTSTTGTTVVVGPTTFVYGTTGNDTIDESARRHSGNDLWRRRQRSN